MRLPPMERTSSPRTGWGRTHWEAVADQLREAAAGYATPDFAQLRLPGRASWAGLANDGLEGYARTFLLAGFRIAGDGGTTGRAARLLERYRRGLLAGTDPASPTAWPVIVDHSQQMVEAAAVAIALHETRPWLWDTLDDHERGRVMAWLEGMTGKQIWQNNWLLFQAVTEQFLLSAGGRGDPAEIERCLEVVDGWYLGDGWYTDGPGRNFDYYIGWAMHLYTLWWTRIAGDDGGRQAVYRERLRAYLEQYQYFFAANGAPVHQGRSLTYRFACAAPLWLGQLFDASPLTPGQTRRLASGVLRHFTERGVPDERGLLSLGWYERFLPVTQPYSGPGSPYWASKGFAGLLLPPDHPVWTDTESAVPVDTGDQAVAMPVPGFLVQSTVADGIVRLLNHGSDHNRPLPASAADDPHYAKLAYSTHTAPDTADPAWRRNVDNHLSILNDAGESSRRTRIEPIAAFDRFAASRSGPVISASVVHGRWEIRAHLVLDPGAAAVREGGYAVAGPMSPRSHTSPHSWALAESDDGLVSAIVGLHGWGAAGVSLEVDANAFGACSATPYLKGEQRVVQSSVFVSLVVLSGDAVHPDAIAASVTTEVSGREAVVRFPCGEVIRLRLDDDPAGIRYTRQPADQPGKPERIQWQK
jgi:hypothetical protein